MVKEIKRQIEQFHMLEKGDRVLIGISGGADSICLAQILDTLKTEYNLELAAVCCHHGLRGEEADQDVCFVEDFCNKRNIAFYKAYEDVQTRAVKKKLSIEEAGREFRYETFRLVMEKYNYNKLAVAHNGDDRAETMLFHMARGTGIAGLCTMEPMRELFDGRYLIRPLLWSKKSAIEAWLIEKKIPWRVDSSNEEDMYTRNRIRHHVLPELSKINNRAVEHMGETAEQLDEICSYLKEEEDRIFERAVQQTEESLVVSVNILRKCHSYMKKTVLHKCIRKMAGGGKDITSGHVKQLLDILEGETGREVHLMKGIRVRREYEFLIFRREKDESKGSDGEGRAKKADSPVPIELIIKKYPYTGQEISKNEYTKQFDCDKILNELCLRFWQEGDYIYLKEDGGKKKLNRYFIDNKIPAGRRGQIPLLADGSHILWIVGHRISAYYKVTDETKEVLEVTVQNKG